MGSDRGSSGRDGDGSGDACGVGDSDGRDEGWWEDQAAEATEWLGACRDAAANGASTTEVGASPVANPALRGDLDALVGAVDALVGSNPVGYAGSDLLEANVALRTQADRLAGVVAEFSRAFDVSGEWLLKARSPSARLAHRCRRSTADTNREVRLGRALIMAERSQTTTGRAAPLVSVLVGTDAFTNSVCRIEQTNSVITPGTLARLFDDHRGRVLIERIVFEGSNRVIEVGDKRFFSGALRRAIEARDVTCQWPGCDHPAVACQIDHVTEHAAGGSTSQDNGQALCGTHNRLKERIRKLMARRRVRHRQDQDDDPAR